MNKFNIHFLSGCELYHRPERMPIAELFRRQRDRHSREWRRKIMAALGVYMKHMMLCN